MFSAGRHLPFQRTNIVIFHYNAKHSTTFSSVFIYFNQNKIAIPAHAGMAMLSGKGVD